MTNQYYYINQLQLIYVRAGLTKEFYRFINYNFWVPLGEFEERCKHIYLDLRYKFSNGNLKKEHLRDAVVVQ